MEIREVAYDADDVIDNFIVEVLFRRKGNILKRQLSESESWELFETKAYLRNDAGFGAFISLFNLWSTPVLLLNLKAWTVVCESAPHPPSL
ncbi:hypothetical protein RJ639_026082 [Escallonia herrerae]|uniref:Uncharacterized protein n=1 Tax=Escallonia herrerae TaxID=1293975 RepID=A0AA88S7G5_9ASTE|nr:hypothetical protein RJ639_026082 [Escallonia herrerae]